MKTIKLFLLLTLISGSQIYSAEEPSLIQGPKFKTTEDIPEIVNRIINLQNFLDENPDYVARLGWAWAASDKVHNFGEGKFNPILDALIIHLAALDAAIRRANRGDILHETSQITFDGISLGTVNFLKAKFKQTLETLNQIKADLNKIKTINPTEQNKKRLILKLIEETATLIEKDARNYNSASQQPRSPIGQKPYKGEPALHWAIRTNQFDKVKQLLSKGQDLSATYQYSLREHIPYGSREKYYFIKELGKEDEDTEVGQPSYTPLELAKQERRKEIAEFLEETEKKRKEQAKGALTTKTELPTEVIDLIQAYQ